MLPGRQEDYFEVWFFWNLNLNPDFPEFGSHDHKYFFEWKKSSRSFILITASYLILSHIDVLMIGILQDKEQSGIYAIASRIAALVAYGLYVSNIILMPYISSLYSEKRYLSLERILKKISRYNFIIAGLIFIIIYILISKIFIPKIKSSIDMREDKIRKDLEEAKTF